MTIDKSILKSLIQEVFEEGKVDKMSRRKASNKAKEKRKYTKPELESMSTEELDDVASETDTDVFVSIHDTDSEIDEATVEAIIDEQENEDG